jgi:hypothetical protein
MLVLGSLSIASMAAAPCHPKISRAAVERLRPFVTKLAEVEAAWKSGGSPDATDSLFDDRFQAVLDDDSSTGDEVLALIAPFYAGESNAEDLQCEVTKRGDRMLPLLRRYQGCPPTPGVDPFPRSLQVVPGVYEDLIRAIADRDTCEYD